MWEWIPPVTTVGRRSFADAQPIPASRRLCLPPLRSEGSRWFWLSAHGAIKCVACAPAPPDLELVEGWMLARETGERDDGRRIPAEILSPLHVASPLQ